MRREDKYPETDTFKFFNENPHNKFTTDCVIRAISGGLEMSYNDVVMELAALQCKTGFDPSENKAIDRYMKSKGWVRVKQPRKDDNTKYTGKEFCRWLSENYPNGEAGNVVCNIGGHHTAVIKPIKDGKGYRYKVVDTWNSTRGCIGCCWTKEGL